MLNDNKASFKYNLVQHNASVNVLNRIEVLQDQWVIRNIEFASPHWKDLQWAVNNIFQAKQGNIRAMCRGVL